MTQPGRLVLVPAPLDFGMRQQAPLADALPATTIAQAAAITHWICENAKTARAFLKRIGEERTLAVPLQQQSIAELPRAVHKKGDHVVDYDARPLLQAALEGHDVGLLSEAGMPAIADPGASVVRAAHALELPVIPLVGPSSLLLTLAASGLNGQSFAFVGYLPQDNAARAHRVRELESLALKHAQTQLFIETPYRNGALWDSLIQTLHPNTRLAVGSGLTLPEARCRCDTVQNWKRERPPVDNDTPAVFAIGR
ncbi:MAG TPA: SAM-dependent methyltransferase [Ramlibacter sp.]|uniref:SAM-dependent methyltransferase n=1 Tax=Ramlibacter sp. TaxID=1917967 RepID=UPI002BA52D66|nr:SAM-dependent methyltransferase [Ramlibacter sp.]HVZ45317.1 SAM-dependent methyltransferase [Ramlibacter sp.]